MRARSVRLSRRSVSATGAIVTDMHISRQLTATPLAFADLTSAMPFLPHMSKSVSGTSMRAGTEPLMTLKADWKLLLMVAAAMAVCAALRSADTLKIANMSVL